MEWDDIFNRLVAGETLTCPLLGTDHRNKVRKYLNKLKRQNSELLIMLDMQDYWFAFKQRDDGDTEISFVPKPKRATLFELTFESGGSDG